MEGTKEKRTRRTRLLLALALVLALASAAAWLLLTVRIGPRRYRRAELIDGCLVCGGPRDRITEARR